MKLDSTDKKILNILQNNGRITNSQLASEIGISPPGMLDRVKRLENAGYIEKYVALVNPEKVGRGTMAIVLVSLAIHQIPSLDRFTEEINQLDEVLECFHVSGEDDFMLKVAVENIQEYEDFVVNKLTRIQGINKINTSFILSTVKYNTKFHIEENL
jgi:Lrp/AsnC family transcriptional regulator, leucine-responsive regulatory protein